LKKTYCRKIGVKKRLNAKGKVEKYTSLLAAKIYSEVEGIDFDDIFSLISKLTYIIFLLSISDTFGIELE
jgi:hypothetical protein